MGGALIPDKDGRLAQDMVAKVNPEDVTSFERQGGVYKLGMWVRQATRTDKAKGNGATRDGAMGDDETRQDETS